MYKSIFTFLFRLVCPNSVMQITCGRHTISPTKPGVANVMADFFKIFSVNTLKKIVNEKHMMLLQP